MSSPPPIKAPARPFERPMTPPQDDGETPRITPRMRRELIVYGGALLFGLIGVPLVIWLGGNRVLGPYTHGQNLHAGPLALLQDYYLGLLHGSAVFWWVALGPAALLLLLRLFIRLVRRMPARREEPEPTATRRAR
ncbi:MAG TPA: hypothetical protein VI195_07460 [Steroidobacteraceae bacterium]